MLVDKFLWKFVSLFPKKVDVIHTENEPYLLRFHLKHCGKLPGVYLHHFYKSDTDRHLHNHPWKNSVSFILSGGYLETKATLEDPAKETVRMYGPGSVNVISDTDFHKVTLFSDKTWSLFISWQRIQEWGFLNKGIVIPHYKYNPDDNTSNGTYITDLLGNQKDLTET